MHGNTTHVVTHELDLASMEPTADLEAESPHGISDGPGAANGPTGTIEGGQDPVACRLDECAPVALDLMAGSGVVSVQDPTPSVSPRSTSISVEPTMSVKRTVARIRSGSHPRRVAGRWGNTVLVTRSAMGVRPVPDRAGRCFIPRLVCCKSVPLRNLWNREFS
jgi:hypothetical protein